MINGNDYTVIISGTITSEVGVYFDEESYISNTQVCKSSHKWALYIFIALIVGAFSFGIAFSLLFKRRDGIDFLFAALLSGIVMTFVIPPYTAPDEMRHFSRSYDISNGNFVCTDYETRSEFGNQTMPICEFPEELYNFKLISESNGLAYYSETNTTININAFISAGRASFSGETVRIPIHGDSTTSSLAFAPQALFIAIARLLKFGPAMLFYFARLGNLLASVAIAFIGYKIIPKYKLLYIVCYFAPGISFLRSTSSTDRFLYSIILLWVAIIIYLQDQKVNIWNIKIISPLLFWGAAIALIKPPYIFISLTFLILDKDIFRVRNQSYARYKIPIVFAYILICLIPYIISHNLLNNSLEISSNLYASSTKIDFTYIQYALTHSLRVLGMIFQTSIGNLSVWLESAITWPNSYNVFIPYLYLIIALLYQQDENLPFDIKQRYALGGIGIGMWVLVVVAFYFIGPAPDIGYIWGLQGRYIYPSLPLIAFALKRNKLSAEKKSNSMHTTTIYQICFLCMGTVALDTFGKYWV